jgi:hypothetical protein
MNFIESLIPIFFNIDSNWTTNQPTLC